jgi:hypothetical protein
MPIIKTKRKSLNSEQRKKISKSKLGNKNPMWKGDNVSYVGLHSWLKRNKKKVKLCECCHTNKPYDLANISGKYKRDVDDYEWLCRKCHMTKDGRLKKLQKYRKKYSDNQMAQMILEHDLYIQNKIPLKELGEKYNMSGYHFSKIVTQCKRRRKKLIGR